MKAKELIEKLQELDPEIEIVFPVDWWRSDSYSKDCYIFQSDYDPHLYGVRNFAVQGAVRGSLTACIFTGGERKYE